jgi:hypothetical protein
MDAMTDREPFQHIDHCVLCIENEPWLIVGKDGPMLTVMRAFAPGILECAVIDTTCLDLDSYVEDASRILEKAR